VAAENPAQRRDCGSDHRGHGRGPGNSLHHPPPGHPAAHRGHRHLVRRFPESCLQKIPQIPVHLETLSLGVHSTSGQLVPLA
jgi:hypothetical protein